MVDHFPYQCDRCPERHRYPISAALCCDQAAFNDDDEDDTTIRSSN